MSDNVDDEIEAQHILITDVSLSNGDVIICWVRSNQIFMSTKWYHQFIVSNKSTEIPKDEHYHGWYTETVYKRPYHKLKLLRKANTVAVEGVFFCSDSEQDGDQRHHVSVGIHYPSEQYFYFDINETCNLCL